MGLGLLPSEYAARVTIAELRKFSIVGRLLRTSTLYFSPCLALLQLQGDDSR